MYVIRVYLRSGAMCEMLFRGKGDCRAAVHKLETAGDRVSLSDDFGKDLDVVATAIDGWQQSDYAAELDGALAINRVKGEAQEKFQRETQMKHSLVVPAGAPNGRMVMG